jgi:hypothetical protein
MMTSAVLATVSESRRVAPGGFLFVEKNALLLLGVIQEQICSKLAAYDKVLWM